MELSKVIRRRDFTAETLRTMHAKFVTGLIPAYLKEKERRDLAVPICALS
jgi:hypothetical protein